MSERTILVPVDGSGHATDGLEYACEEYPDAEIVVLYVASFDGLSTDDDIRSFADVDRWLDHERDRATAIVEDAEEHAATLGREVTTETQIGRPAAEIVSYAAERDVDHIVMGSRGRTDDPETSLGSVAETVMRDAPVLVTVVR